MNGSQVPKIGSFLVEGFRFLEETILYLVVFGGNIPYSQDTLAGTSNRSKFGGFAVGHFVYIQSENRMINSIFNMNDHSLSSRSSYHRRLPEERIALREVYGQRLLTLSDSKALKRFGLKMRNR